MSTYALVKREFFQAVTKLVLLYGCTTRTPTKRLEEKLDGNYTKQELYGYSLPIL